MDSSQNNVASAPPAEEQVQRVEEAAAGGNPVEGNPSAANMASQAQTQTTQNTAEGDAATPLETGVRQCSDAEKQWAANAKAAREAALVKLNKERRQKRLRDAQELNDCLGSGMDLLTPEQVWQITEAAMVASNKPMGALRGFGERLRNLREENPHASETDFREAVKGAEQGDDHQIKRVAAESRYSASGAERSVAPSRSAQGGPPGYPWTPFQQNVAGSGIRSGTDAQLHQSHRV